MMDSGAAVFQVVVIVLLAIIAVELCVICDRLK